MREEVERAEATLAEREQMMGTIMLRYNEALARERAAWGDRRRTTPRKKDEWESAWRSINAVLPGAIQACGEYDRQVRLIARLRDPEEVRVRVAIASKWLKGE